MRPAATLRWGLYTFIPSISALEWLAAYTPKRVLPVPKTQPAATKQETPAWAERTQFGTEPLSALGQATKAQLEDIFKAEDITAHVADVLLNQGGISVEPEYAVMAAAAPIVKAMLTDPGSYSVRSYWGRMKACEATLYLGMDPQPAPLGAHDPCPAFTQDVKADSYKKESTSANKFIWGITWQQGYEAAHAAALGWFKEQNKAYGEARALFANAAKPLQPAPVLDLQALAGRVIRDVAVALYGIPEALLSDDPDLELPVDPDNAAPASPALRCPVDLTSVFAHVFPPRPSRTVSADAAARGKTIKQKVKDWYDAHPEQVNASTLIQNIRSETSPQDADFEQRTVIGLLSGFAVPTNGSLVSVLMQLVQSEELWRLQRTLQDIQLENVGHTQLRANLAPLTARIFALMMAGPVPAMIHRTAMNPTTFQTPVGSIDLNPGDLVALNLGGAAAHAHMMGAEDPWKYLFGDVPRAELDKAHPPVHRCPGQEMAMGVIHGTLVVLLAQPRLKKTASPLTLTQYVRNDSARKP